MIEKGVCETCKHATEDKQCNPCWSCGLADWQPSELYTAYLAEKERADAAEAQANYRLECYDEVCKEAERYKQALNCGECDDGFISLPTRCDPCPNGCAEIRKEAAKNA